MYNQPSFGRQFIQMIKNSGNPQQLLQETVQNNPQLGIMDVLLRNGGNAKQAFYEMAKQKGVNPDDVLNMLK